MRSLRSVPTLKAIRDHRDSTRHAYVNALRTVSWFRDRGRRAIVKRLPDSRIRLGRSEGFVILKPGEIAGVDAVREQAHSTLARFDPLRTGSRNKKSFLINVLDRAELRPDSPLIEFALREELLSSLARYLGLAPLLTHISVFYSPSAENAPRSSQLYHCDGDDVTQVKVFVYCTNVDEQSGPLTILDADTSAFVRQRLKYRFDQHVSDEQLRAIVRTPIEWPVMGPAGTAVLVDTSRCFHYGSRVAPGAPARLAAMIQYQTPYSFMLRDKTQGLPFRHLAEPHHTALQRLALGV